MYSFVSQDWITISSATNGDIILQTERDWLDMSPYQDVVAWLDVREASGSGGSYPLLALETAPIKDQNLFKEMNATATEMVPSATSATVIQSLMGSAAVPVAQWLRWKITGRTTPWYVTFRLFIAANAPGLQLPTDGSPELLLRPEM